MSPADTVSKVQLMSVARQLREQFCRMQTAMDAARMARADGIEMPEYVDVSLVLSQAGADESLRQLERLIGEEVAA
jgi:hypothetical protein